MHGDGLPSGGHAYFGVRRIVRKEIVSGVVWNEDVGIVAKRVVERRRPPWIHDASSGVGAVEYVVDVVRGIFDVVERSCAVESQLIAARSAVSVVGHDTKFQVNRSKGWGQESRNGYVDGAVVASATPA